MPRELLYLIVALFFLVVAWLLLGLAESRAQPPGHRDAPLAGAARAVLVVVGVITAAVAVLYAARWVYSLVAG